LAAEPAFGAHFARHPGHFRRERVELVHHRVDRVLQLEDLPAHFHGNLLGQVTAGHRGGDLGDVAHLAGEIVGHQIDVVGEVGPRPGDAGHERLAAEFALGADLASDAGDFGGERIELVDHRVDGVLQLEDLSLDRESDVQGQGAGGHRGGNLGDVADRAGDVRGDRVHVVGEVRPGAADPGDVRLTAELSFGADLARHAGHFAGKSVELVDHRVDGVLQLEDLSLDVDGDLLRQVAGGDRGGDFGDVA